MRPADPGRAAHGAAMNALSRPRTRPGTPRAREPRSAVALPATLHDRGGKRLACVRNVSSKGMMVETAIPPPVGAAVTIRVGPVATEGRVIWRKNGRFGMVGTHPVAKAALVARDRRCDRFIRHALLRRGRRSDRSRPAALPHRYLARLFQWLSTLTFAIVMCGFLAIALFEMVAVPMRVVTAHLAP